MKVRGSLVVALVLLLFATTAIAQLTVSTSCSTANLKGEYGVWEQGTMLYFNLPGFPFSPPQPEVLAAHATYDGAGHLSAVFKMNLGGVPIAGTLTGTYTIGSDCTYAETFTPIPGNVPLQIFGVVTGEGMFREVHYLYTNGVRVVSGSVRKVPPGGCSLNTVRGRWVVFGDGQLRTGPTSLIQVNHVGPFTIDAKGHFSGSEYKNIAGVANPDMFTGDVTVNSDCTLSNVITDSNGLVSTEWGVLTGEGRSQEVHAIVTSPGLVLVEHIKRQ